MVKANPIRLLVVSSLCFGSFAWSQGDDRATFYSPQNQTPTSPQLPWFDVPALSNSMNQPTLFETVEPVGTADEEEFSQAIVDTEKAPMIPNMKMPWQPPNYADQKEAIGWKSDVFAVPNGMQARVDFWKDIYTKYTTTQGVLHDSYYVDIVYDKIDFTSIRADSSLSPRAQRKKIEKVINEKRKEISERLLRLAKLDNGDGLEGEDARYWKMFSRLHDKNRYTDAADKGRIRFQLGQSDRFVLGIFYSGRYLRQMEKIFRSENVPIELTRLPFVESSFNIFARSRVGASGVWQFMRRTAKYYMKVNNVLDERNDPLRAARAAARMLRQNYQFLSTWPLAITGWNHGPNGVHKIVKQLGTTDIGKIVNTYSSRSFGFASENFYASFLAALQVESEAKKYFGNVYWSAEPATEEIASQKPLAFSTLKLFFDNDLDHTLLLNPQFQPSVRKGSTPIPAGYIVRVPSARADLAKRFIAGDLTLAKLQAESHKFAQTNPLVPESAKQKIVAVATPAAAAPIAPVVSTPNPSNVAGTPTASLVAVPAPTTPAPAVATPTAAVAPVAAAATPVTVASPPTEAAKTQEAANAAPASAPPATPAAAQAASASVTPATQFVVAEQEKTKAGDITERPPTYRVRRGDNLSRISHRLRVSLYKLMDANPDLKDGAIHPGQVLKVPERETISK